MATNITSGKIYVVEHLDPELEEWSALEYQTIANECAASGSHFLLSSVSPKLQLPPGVLLDGVEATEDSVEKLFADRKHRICLLDPAAKSELSPEDAHHFDIFLFGGILGDDPPRGRRCSVLMAWRNADVCQIERRSCERRASPDADWVPFR